MTNCEKCGNPLQPGLTSCPICGTSASNSSSETTLTTEIESLEDIPVSDPAPQMASAPAPIETTPTPIEDIKVPSEPLNPLGTTEAAPAQQQTSTNVAPQETVSQADPFGATPFNNSSFGGTSVIEEHSNDPSIPVAEIPVSTENTTQPAPLSTPTLNVSGPKETPTQPVPNKDDNKKQTITPDKKTKKSSPIILVLIALISLALGATGGLLLAPKQTTTPLPVVDEPVQTAQVVKQAINGYQFEAESDWKYTDYYGKVIINDPNESIIIRVSKNDGVFSNISTKNIELSLSTKEGYSNIVVDKTTLGEREAIIVDAKNGDSNIQYYYIPLDVQQVFVITVIYENNETKAEHEETVKELIQTIKYDDTAQNGIQALDPYTQLLDDSNHVYYDGFSTE